MTRSSTTRIIEHLEHLGRACGLEPFREVSPGVPKSYAPRADLVLCGPPLADEAVAAIDRLAAMAGITSPLVAGRVPFVGIEVEGTDPSSKTMESDSAKRRVGGYPIGVLAVDSAPGGAGRNTGDIHRRACRLRRTTTLWCGPRPLAVIDASRLPTRAPKSSTTATAGPAPEPRFSNVGGSRSDATRARDALLRRGHALGFHASSDASPHLPRAVFAARHKTEEDASALVHLGIAGTELGHETAHMFRKEADAFTLQKIDVLWSVPVPPGLATFHALLAQADPDYGTLWPEAPVGETLCVAAFELDTHAGKHAGGSLLHLARAARLGAMVVPDANIALISSLLDTYRRVMPVGAVAILGFETEGLA